MGNFDEINEDNAGEAGKNPEIEWYAEELNQRAENMENGTDRFIGLEDAEQRIREKTGRQ